MARRVNFLAFAPHYLDHMVPVWNAFRPSERGVFWVRSKEAEEAAKRHRIHTRQWPNRISNGSIVVSSAFGDLNQADKAGVKTVLMEHGAGQTYNSSHSSYAGGSHPARDRVTLYLVPGARPAEKLRLKHPDIPVVEVGCPKLDKRITRPSRQPQDPPVVVFSFHWDCKVVPETTWAFPFYRRALELASKRTDIRIVGHAHPRAARTLRPWFESRGIEYIPHLDTVMDVADVYVCDNSSSIFEASAVGIPVVLLNSPRYRRDIEHGLRFWEAANIGPQVDSSRDLIPAIFDALNPSPEQQAETQRCLDLVYSVRDGSSATKAVEAIRKHVL